MTEAKSRTIVVTGASRGLGETIADRAAKAGYNVIGLARNPPFAEKTWSFISCDVTDPAALRQAATAIAKQQPIWAVVNAAGVAAMNLALSTPTETVEKVVRVNLLGTIFVFQAFLPQLIRGKGGRVINFSTIAVPLGLAGESVYVASKAGVEGFSRTVAREASAFGITVNCIAPGPVDTDLIAAVPSASIDKIIAQQVIRRKGSKDDIWNIAQYLLSDAASMVSGQVINVGGA